MHSWDRSLIGTSKSFLQATGMIPILSVSKSTVLITGETGTGKELFARAIHYSGGRGNKPFVPVNCAALPDHLIENELFGHSKGAFTGALMEKPGLLHEAEGGTLFLDEIGELAPPLQVKLLRFLQDRKIERVGGTNPFEVDVRIIAATNRNLKEEMQNQVFREDLYYRLKVVPLDMPPLRERKEDIIPLARHFLARYCKEHRKPAMTLSHAAENALLQYLWPGNVRELENLINRAVVLSPRNVLTPGDLGFTADQIRNDVNLKVAKKAIELEFLNKALSRNHGIVSRAARELGISRVNLYELIEKYNLRLHEFKMLKAAKSPLKVREVS